MVGPIPGANIQVAQQANNIVKAAITPEAKAAVPAPETTKVTPAVIKELSAAAK